MNWFGNREGSKKTVTAKVQDNTTTTNNNNNNNNNNYNNGDYEDIPVITDAVVVQDDDEVEGIYVNPPAMNPNYQLQQLQMQSELQPQQRLQPQQPMVAKSNTHNFHLPPSAIYHNRLGRNSTGLECPACHNQTITIVREVIGTGTIVAILILALIFWPLCWLPLCMPSCHRTNHYCAICHQKIGETTCCS